jgi:hypothetical protein
MTGGAAAVPTGDGVAIGTGVDVGTGVGAVDGVGDATTRGVGRTTGVAIARGVGTGVGVGVTIGVGVGDAVGATTGVGAGVGTVGSGVAWGVSCAAIGAASAKETSRIDRIAVMVRRGADKRRARKRRCDEARHLGDELFRGQRRPNIVRPGLRSRAAERPCGGLCRSDGLSIRRLDKLDGCSRRTMRRGGTSPVTPLPAR